MEVMLERFLERVMPWVLIYMMTVSTLVVTGLVAMFIKQAYRGLLG